MRRAAIALCACAAACGGADGGAGFAGLVRVEGAQPVGAPLPESDDGPAVTFVEQRTTRVFAGEAGVPLAGRTAGAARTVLVGIPGDDVHWIVPVGLPDDAVAGELEFSLRLELDRAIAPGPLAIALAAVDRDGRVGPHREASWEVTGDEPTGELVITLAWDRDVDLDLYVVDPDGVELSPKDPNSYRPPPPGQPPDPPDQWMQGGILDVDSNAACVIDGRRRESAVWRQPPPAGRYRVLVDLASPCDQALAGFTVRASRSGAPIGEAAGLVYASDARDNRASGGTALLVLELDVE